MKGTWITTRATHRHERNVAGTAGGSLNRVLFVLNWIFWNQERNKNEEQTKSCSRRLGSHEARVSEN